MENRELMHYGVKGMRWGHRKTYRSAVKTANAAADAARKETLKNTSRIGNSTYQRHRKANVAANKAYMDSMKKSKAEAKAARVAEKTANPNKGLSDKQKTALTIGATATTTALAAYGTYKVNKFIRDKGYEKNYNSGKKAVARWMEDQKYENVINDYFSYTKEDHYRTATQTIKQLIANNEVNGKVDWKNVLRTFK